MTKYHISPKTGRPNICRAKIKACPIGGEHFETKKEALEGHEKQNKEATLPKPIAKDNTLSQDQIYQNEIKHLDNVIKVTEDKLEKLRNEWRRNPEKRIMIEEQSHSYSQNLLNAKSAKEKIVKKLEVPLTKENLKNIITPALAHNSGKTVQEVKERQDSIEIKLSSWPRAQEAKSALERKGFIVQTGTNDGGQWIRVSQKPKQFIESKSLSWNGKDQFSWTIGSDEEFPRFIKSSKTNEFLEIKELEPVYRENGTLEHWIGKPYSPEHKWTLKINVISV